jgi:hypothetical protein
VSFRLPALKSLGELSNREPILVCDTREQEPLTFTRLRAVRGTLVTGDYSVLGCEQEFAIERKGSLDEAAAIAPVTTASGLLSVPAIIDHFERGNYPGASVPIGHPAPKCAGEPVRLTGAV